MSEIKKKLKFRIRIPFRQWLYTKRLKFKKQINVVFLAASRSMWRYQHLYEEMSKHPRFNVKIVIQPFNDWPQTAKEESKKELRKYFDDLSIPYILGTRQDGSIIDMEKEISPDILFYPQPYPSCYPTELSFENFKHKLLCYYPYAFWRSKGEWSYDMEFHRFAWKLFYSTELHRKDAKEICYNKGLNVEVVGYPNSDDFLFRKHKDVWKKQESKKKRIIWATHFSINKGSLLEQSNFLWMAELMINIAKKYSDKIQMVFKPHPHLLRELCRHKEWGEARAKDYYDQWNNMENTQLETGDFVDIFMTSDAMIHDCGSFCVEYHYSGNPVMYVADNFDKQVEAMADFGKLAMQQHYVGKTEQDIVDFIEKRVLGNDDPMKKQRLEFVQEYLIPPNDKTVAQNTMDVLLRKLC